MTKKASQLMDERFGAVVHRLVGSTNPVFVHGSLISLFGSEFRAEVRRRLGDGSVDVTDGVVGGKDATSDAPCVRDAVG